MTFYYGPRRSLLRPARVTLSYLTSAVDINDLTTYTFSAQTLGTEHESRRIVVGVTGRIAAAGVAVSTLTVRGISARRAVAVLSGDNAAELWMADVPSGTSGDVVVTWAGAQSRCGIGLHAVYGAASLVPFATATQTTNNTATNVIVPGDGVAIGCTVNVGGGATCTWTNLTERYDEITETTVLQSGASAEFSGGGTKALTYNWTAASGANGVYASWGP